MYVHVLIRDMTMHWCVTCQPSVSQTVPCYCGEACMLSLHWHALGLSRGAIPFWADCAKPCWGDSVCYISPFGEHHVSVTIRLI